jgi:tRNA nucleotidyltransferase (CCA-adding enzyme)
MELPSRPELVARLRAEPWAPPLLGALDGVADAHLVGGAVRDLLLGDRPLDLDLVVEGDATAVARELARRLGGRSVVHARFGTATVRSEAVTFDVVSARAERYPEPGALPEVRAGTLEEDLARRDFTINAIAMALEPPRLGELRHVPRALEDLAAGAVRVLHERSFHDDPTRLLRAVRYESRLSFALEARTEALLREAIAAGALATVSGARIRDELLDLLGEPAVVPALARMAELGLDRALGLHADAALVQRALALAPPDARRDLLAFGACALHLDADELRMRTDRLALRAGERGVVLATAGRAPALAAALNPPPRRDSELAARVRALPVETVALAGALGAEVAARRWIEHVRHVGLQITGADLRAAGVPEGPELGRGLRVALDRKLDGELDGREDELRAALEAARGD